MSVSSGESNFVSYELDNNGDLFLKYFLIDASTASNTFAGEWSVTPEAIAANDQKAVGIPFTVLPTKDLSINLDWHAWNPNPDATIDDHRAFARNYAPGYVKAITRDSSIMSGAVNDIKKNGGRFAIVHINDKRARDAYIKNPELIPKAVSPGILGDTKKGQIGVDNFEWVHLAAVPKGAFGDKATLYGKCIGPHNQCVNSLLSAAVKDLDKNTTYCPIGASELISSLGNSSTNSSQMSVNASTEGTTSPPPVPNQNIQATPPAQQGAPIAAVPQTEQQKGQAVLKIKTPVGQPNQPASKTVDLKEHEKLRKEFEEYKQSQEQNARKEQIKKLIPPQLFIAKGKFDENAYNAEVEKRASQGWDDATISEHYNMKMEILKAQATTNTNPLAGGYQTPSEVPLGGSSQDSNDSVNVTIGNLLSRFMRSDS